MDDIDSLENDPTQWSDVDFDGHGDNLEGNNPDYFPFIPGQWIDEDGDGYGDNPTGPFADVFPRDPTQWTDSDGDGYGDVQDSQVSCDVPLGYVADATDCDDGEDDTWPGAPEFCNGADDNCDGSIDESSAQDAGLWYADSDGDGGNAVEPTLDVRTEARRVQRAG